MVRFNDKGAFVVFGMGRTGSTLLTSLLDSHPQICCETEIFRLGRWRRHQRPIAHILRYYPWPYLFYRRARAQILLAKSVYGFKLHTKGSGGQLADMEGFLHTAHHAGWKIIHLQRASIFDQVLSEQVGMLTGRYFGNSRKPAPSPYVTIPADRFAGSLEQAAMIRADHRRMLLEIPHTTVVYEDDLAQQDTWLATITRLCAYLDVSAPAQVTTRFKKPWDRPYSDVVANYDELVEVGKMYQDSQ